MRVHFQHEPEGPAQEALREALGDGFELSFGDGPPPSSIEVLVSGRPSREQLDACDKLKTLVIPFAGVPATTLEVMREYPGIIVHNLHHNASATAELAVTLLLAAAKTIVPIDRQLRRGDWSARGGMEHAMQLAGRNALVLGYGAIGSRVARTCAALGMTVNAIARRPRANAEHPVSGPDALAGMLLDAAAVLVCLPATSETEGMIGREQLSLLPRESVVVNVARGPIIDEAALYEALRERRIFAAGLDVWWNYPKTQDEWTATQPSRLPFHELDNVVMSPHRGGHVSDTELQRMLGLAELLKAIATGASIPNRVDLTAGY
ncbi:MAG: hydroxyacid dehydrogenase [Planctomycetes bacterium]|nr:hydroxyacid dehydrogenase [Planctomycetota bacterium]